MERLFRSTEAVPSTRLNEHWRSSLRDAFDYLESDGALSVRPGDTIRHWTSGDFRLNVVAGSGGSGSVRTRAPSPPTYYFGMFLKGSGSVLQGNELVSIAEGEGILIDVSDSYIFDFGESEIVSFSVPLSLFEGLQTRPEVMARSKITSQSPWGSVLNASLMAASQSMGRMDERHFTAKSQILSTFAMALDGQELVPVDHRTELGRKLTRSLHERYFDKAITPRRLAREFSISLRQLHLCFASAGTTYGTELMKARLNHARAMLSDGRFSSANLTDIAVRCGFADASHLRRRFKERYSQSPADYRHAALGQASV